LARGGVEREGRDGRYMSRHKKAPKIVPADILICSCIRQRGEGPTFGKLWLSRMDGSLRRF
jgi:hypothetical protein